MVGGLSLKRKSVGVFAKGEIAITATMNANTKTTASSFRWYCNNRIKEIDAMTHEPTTTTRNTPAIQSWANLAMDIPVGPTEIPPSNAASANPTIKAACVPKRSCDLNVMVDEVEVGCMADTK